MTHIAIITAKGGNQSLENKNVRLVAGKPCLAWPVEAAFSATQIDGVFVSTEDKLIRDVAISTGAEVIDRPVELAQPFTNHGDVILHAAREASRRFGEPTTVTILLGNTVMVTASDIDAAISRTMSEPDIDSCMTVWLAQDDHPYRALKIGKRGFLEPFLDIPSPDTNRQSYPPAYFYDQGPWTVRYSSLLRSENTREGPGPWWWMGRNAAAIERDWFTGRDTHTEMDLRLAEWWISEVSNPSIARPPHSGGENT